MRDESTEPGPRRDCEVYHGYEGSQRHELIGEAPCDLCQERKAEQDQWLIEAMADGGPTRPNPILCELCGKIPSYDRYGEHLMKREAYCAPCMDGYRARDVELARLMGP